LAFCDEVPAGLSVKLIDVSDLNNIQLKDTLKSNPGATAHNPYITNSNHLILSYYQDGVCVFDMSNPAYAQLTGYFDTDYLHGLNDSYSFSTPYRGCWGTYPYLPSGILLASDMQNGLFVLDASIALQLKSTTVKNEIQFYPNPGNEELNINFYDYKKGNYEVIIYDVNGKKIMNQNINVFNIFQKLKINTSDLTEGVYFININGTDTSIKKKWVKITNY
jgi:hypothetical protein